MNRIFKVIWSKSKQCKIVVSEIVNSFAFSAFFKSLKSSSRSILSVLILYNLIFANFIGFTSYAFSLSGLSGQSMSSVIKNTDNVGSWSYQNGAFDGGYTSADLYSSLNNILSGKLEHWTFGDTSGYFLVSDDNYTFTKTQDWRNVYIYTVTYSK